MTAAQAAPSADDLARDALFRAIPHVFDPPLDPPAHGDRSWYRAQTESDEGGPLPNDVERMVLLDDSTTPRRVVFALVGSTLRAKCGCRSFQYRDWCAHTASLWWRWVRGAIDVVHADTGRTYQDPPPWLRLGETADVPEEELRALPPKQLDAWLHCEYGDEGPTAHARRTGRAKGTVGNHLTRAREAVGRCR